MCVIHVHVIDTLHMRAYFFVYINFHGSKVLQEKHKNVYPAMVKTCTALGLS